jgi:uncharacterized protein YbjT (DUF2867 family)
MPADPVFITGGTGYVGRPLIEELLRRGRAVHALARRGSESKLPVGAVPIVGSALAATTFASSIPPRATVVHLVGTPRPNPRKAAEFERVDQASIQATVDAIRGRDVRHLVYVSVAHPAPVMKAYIAVRQKGEAMVRELGIPATILRPWYVLGPGHYWPYALVPLYAVLARLPSTREGAQRLGLVTQAQMVRALLLAIDAPPINDVRVVEVPQIRRGQTVG